MEPPFAAPLEGFSALSASALVQKNPITASRQERDARPQRPSGNAGVHLRREGSISNKLRPLKPVL